MPDVFPPSKIFILLIVSLIITNQSGTHATKQIILGIGEPPVNSNLDFDFLLPELQAEAAAGTRKDAEKVNLNILTGTAIRETTSLQNNLDEYFLSAGRKKERTEVIALRDLH